MKRRFPRVVVLFVTVALALSLGALPANASKGPPRSYTPQELGITAVPQAPAAGTWQIFAGNFSPTSVNAVAMFNSTDGWMVGDAGKTWRWNGSAWNFITSTVGFNLNWVATVPGSATGEAWAAGENSTQAVHFVNGAWKVVPFAAPGTTTGQVDSIFFSSPTDGWMTGGSGKMFRFSGGETWTNAGPVAAVQLHDVATTADGTSGWAVGEGGTIVRWNGTSWAPVTSPTTLPLFKVDIRSATEAWAVGGVSSTATTPSQGIILHWVGPDPNNWQIVPNPAGVNVHYWAIDFATATDAWITGDGGTILHFDGAAWTLAQNLTPDSLYDVFMVSPTDGWIVGATQGGSADILRLGAGGTPPPNLTPMVLLPFVGRP